MPEDFRPSVDDIQAGLSSVEQKTSPDVLDEKEIKDVENARKQQEIADLESDRGLREKYANRILRFLECYAATVAIFLVLNGFRFKCFSLPDEVLITLVSSTAVAAIGLVGFIAKGLFGKKR
ncbi:hypothetical protein [uncultured Thalassospira sp.]|jgi:hypothetical protein|uniref:hypothetical protein n=1 Tax=uncultured Thalassospira sp. TaxID=404382 RepID=UPI0030D7CAE9|tara:strand:+ start:874 stop:1239 length:366 start_codon:yes stop_codon:yes gene_type:complete